MAIALVDTNTIFESLPGSGVVEAALPTHGARDLTIAALVFNGFGTVDVASRRPPYPSGLFPYSIVDAPGWLTVVDAAPLLVLAHYGEIGVSDLELAVNSGGGTLEGVLCSWSGVSESGRQVLTSTGIAPPTGPGNTFGLGLSIDSLVVSVIGWDRQVYDASIAEGGWSIEGNDAAVNLAWFAGFGSEEATWSWDTFDTDSVNWSGATIAATGDRNELAVLHSTSYVPEIRALAPAPGDPPVEFSELKYRSDGIPPEPEPVLTPTEPWWRP